ncbi:conserved hypothetical protein (plasmid) [Pseudarthrobacter chlorophenolicus A6]|uniref:DUF4192 domain-containing protein n=1 Tax=Pseudarthrobacter chlorophenolicus (strain ATCC 700700 / DSM 12829 / CIP 107037 / JCM 12360 / KCTC 9906 / NCIMB 13794 / A6) TaxID=452863 RepID=B8HJ47_PSECP|nr:DUF4192 domain-containing protein [Pseudarthrobacter chlorophenolicus]ACL42445.1 conserved hypothetical protein [Pseudarthrobacter chlorophenolicus A6]SDQ09458.1 protein of unknown function [Pseudarthrobacter chlorophenolicus]
MNDFIKFTGPADVLAFIPHTLGFAPQESFVAITMQGNKIGATLRVDAPFGLEPANFAQTTVSYLTADEAATGSLLVIYTDENTPGKPQPYSDHVEALRTELETAGMPLQDAWLVTSELWRNYHCTDTSCCPNQTLDAIITSNGNAALIYRGSAVHGFTAPAPFAGDETARDAIAAHKPDGWPEDLEASRAAWAKVLDNPKSLTTQTAHELAGALQHPTIRDYMMGDIITHAPDQFTSVMLGVFLTRPDWARVDTAQEVAFELMKATPEGQRAPMLCLIGWLEWLKGKSSFAARYFKLALDDVAEYRLAELLAELVNRGLLADCTRDPKKAYNRQLSR